jgi:glutamine amidotransferase
MIAVISYGVSNVGSILNMLRRSSIEAMAVSTPADVARADKIILPGVGAFDNGVTALSSLGLVEPLKHRVICDRIPILGICLGMQLLGRSSEEGVLDGLGLIEGKSVRFRTDGSPELKVPHMGWNAISPKRESPLWRNLGERRRFYFVHSYHLVCSDPGDVLATTHYGTEFTSMVQHGNVYGAQFHPEKSHRFGMTLLRNFSGI